MLYLMILLRVIHIFAGAFWVGVSFFNIYFLQPTVRATGTEGSKVMQHLTRGTRFTSTVYTAATLNMLSGLIMYWIISGFDLAFLTSGYGLVLTIGAIAGLVAWLVAILVIRDVLNRMAGLGQQIQAQGEPPTPEQSAQLGALGARLMSVGQANLVFMTISLTGMSMAQYAGF
ncbi:MAG: hypothetical protein A2Z16_13055 [Chloroflexi bacterium RBG_16_54_18]|nr:MAG: hypothetical protein A2Z16_13055 [Chloroflexi bacterium RBG_16_54_18]